MDDIARLPPAALAQPAVHQPALGDIRSPAGLPGLGLVEPFGKLFHADPPLGLGRSTPWAITSRA